MKPSGITKHRVTPFNIKNGNTAPYFLIEAGQAKKDELVKLASEEFKQRSALAKYSNWNLEIEKV